MECKKLEGQIVIPVFYKIDPSHVRKQSGSYMNAFEKYERDFMIDKDKVLKWKAALTEAANLAGYGSQSYRTDYEFIEDIVKGVLKKLNDMYPSESRGLVGVEKNCAIIESLLRMHSSKLQIIGIWGIGGIGKTTLAAILFAKLALQYEGRCFLENVRTKSEKYGLNYLRSMLHSELSAEDHICNFQAESSIDLSMLKGKKVFIVLDDISTLEQLKCLVGDCGWLGLGSKVIVTTRDKHMVSRGVDEIYEVKELSFKDSLQLFSLNAFNKPNPEMQYEELSVRAVVRVGGIPLTLKIWSAFLRSKSEEQWDNALRKLKKNAELRDVLRLIYDDLDYHEKYTLLGIAFFLKGLNKKEVIRHLDGKVLHPHIRIKNLVNKALITISNYKILEMHHLIQEIFEESFGNLGKQSRSLVQDVYHTSNNNQGTNADEGTTILGSSNRCNVSLPSCLQAFAFGLRDLCWNWSEYALKSLPSTFCMKNIVELSIVNSPLEKLWNGVQNFPDLKILKVIGCKYLLELPDLSGALNLEAIYLIGCTSLKVHPSVLSFPKLQRLYSDQCNTLKSLRSKASSNSSKYLSVMGCSNLQEFFMTPKKKQRLYLGSTSTGELPPSTSRLEMLDYLTFRVTENFEKLETLLDSLWHIKELDLSECTLFELPENINKLIFLRSLELNGSRLVRLPANIKHLSWLRFLGLRKCKFLNSLPELPPLVHLDARDCSSLEAVSPSTSEPPIDLISKSAASYLFENCTRLDQDALITIMVDASVRIKQAADNLVEGGGSFDDKEDDDIGKISFCVPGNKCPYWFSYCSTQPLLTIELPSPSKILGFAFCVILPAFESDDWYNVGCECSFEADDGETINLESWFLNDRLISVGENKLISDHIYLWFDARGSAFIMDKLMYSRVNIKKFSFRFFTTPQYIKEMSSCDMKEVMVRSCGVQPIYGPIDLITGEDGKEFHDPSAELSRQLIYLTPPPPWMAQKRRRNDAQSKSLIHPTVISVTGSSSHQRFRKTINEEVIPTMLERKMYYAISWLIERNICRMHTVPESLRNLRKLNLSRCTFSELPDDIDHLVYLQSLWLCRSHLVRLPENIKHFSWLKYLGLYKCRKLQYLPELPPLFKLDARGCISLKNVSCSVSEDHSQSAVSYLFENCLRLGQHAVESMMADAHVRIMQAANNISKEDYLDEDDDDDDDEDDSLDDKANLDNGKISFCLPGNKFPDWFSYCSTKALLTIELPSPSKFLGFAFCVILAAKSNAINHIDNLGCECSLEADDGEIVSIKSWFINNHLCHVDEDKLISDHVYLWYDARYSARLRDQIEHSRENYSPKFSFTFFTESRYDKGMTMSPCEVEDNMKEVMIRSCGVQPIYAFAETHESKSHPKITRQSIPSLLSSNSWKQNERKSLKEILFLGGQIGSCCNREEQSRSSCCTIC